MSTFPLFPELPPELRRQVWIFAVHSLPPRIITLYPDSRLQEQNTPVPSFFYVCHEAREVFQSIYELSLGSGKRYSELRSYLPLPPAAEDLWVNFERDLIYLPLIRLPRPSMKLYATDDGNELPWPLYHFPNVGILKAQRLATKIYFEGYGIRGEPDPTRPAAPGRTGSATSVWERFSEFSKLSELYVINGCFQEDEYAGAFQHNFDIGLTIAADSPAMFATASPALTPMVYIHTQVASNARNDPGGWNAPYLTGLLDLAEGWELEKGKGLHHIPDWKIVAESNLPLLFEQIRAG